MLLQEPQCYFVPRKFSARTTGTLGNAPGTQALQVLRLASRPYISSPAWALHQWILHSYPLLDMSLAHDLEGHYCTRSFYSRPDPEIRFIESFSCTSVSGEDDDRWYAGTCLEHLLGVLVHWC